MLLKRNLNDDAKGELDRSRRNPRMSRQRPLELIWLPKYVALVCAGAKVSVEEASRTGIPSAGEGVTEVLSHYCCEHATGTSSHK